MTIISRDGNNIMYKNGPKFYTNMLGKNETVATIISTKTFTVEYRVYKLKNRIYQIYTNKSDKNLFCLNE